MDINQQQRTNKNKVMQWGYTILIWVLPVLYLTLYPWILNQTKFLARNEITFGPDASMVYHNLSVFILPIGFKLLLGAGVFVLVFGVRKFNSKAILIGNLLGVLYALLILLSYPIYFNSNFVFKMNQQLVNQIFRLGMYSRSRESQFYTGLLWSAILPNFKKI